MPSYRKVVAGLCIGFAETINKVGPAFLEGCKYFPFITTTHTHSRSFFTDVEAIGNLAMQILEQRAVCQQDPDQEEAEADTDDSAEYDSVLVSSAGDLVAALANASGTDFGLAFGSFFPQIAKYYVSTHLFHARIL